MASKSKRRRRVLGASCILAALIVAGSSFAWFTSKDEVTNRLTASSDYGVSIVESFVPPKNMLPGQTVNKDVYAVNTGTIDAFVKETVKGVLNYDYEVLVNDFDAKLEKLTVAEVEAIQGQVETEDGIKTYEAGGFLAWTDATTTTTAYSYDADEEPLVVGTEDGTLVKGTYSATDENNEAKNFTYKLVMGGKTYFGVESGSELADNSVLYEISGTVGNYTYDSSAGTKLTLTKQDTVTPYPTGPINNGRTEDVTETPDPNNPGVATPVWKPTIEGAYVFRRAINKGEETTNPFTYAGYYYVPAHTETKTVDDGNGGTTTTTENIPEAYYKIVLGNDSDKFPATKDGDNYVFDIIADSKDLVTDVKTDIDADTGVIKEDVSYKFIDLKNSGNQNVTLEFEGKSEGVDGHPARLVAEYTTAVTADGDRYDASAVAARAQVAYENARGKYDAAVDSLKNAQANADYGQALAKAENDLYLARRALEDAYTANSDSSTDYTAKKNEVNDWATDMDNGTKNLVGNDGIKARTTDDGTTNNDLDDGMTSLKPSSGGLFTVNELAAYSGPASNNQYVAALQDVNSAYHKAFANYEKIFKEIYGTNGNGDGGLYKDVNDLLTDIQTSSGTNAAYNSTTANAHIAKAKADQLVSKAQKLVDKMEALRQAYAALKDVEANVTGLELSDTATDTAQRDVIDSFVTIAENFKTNANTLSGLVDDYLAAEDQYKSDAEALSGEASDWAKAVDDYNTAVTNAKTAYEKTLKEVNNTGDESTGTGKAWDNHTTKHASESQAKVLVPTYSAKTTANGETPNFTEAETATLKNYNGSGTLPAGLTNVTIVAMAQPEKDDANFKATDYVGLEDSARTSASKQTVTEWENEVAGYKTALTQAAKAYSDAKAAVAGASTIKFYINLADQYATDWTMDPDTDKHEAVDFYLNKILVGGETSGKLIDSVTFDKDVTPADYKNLKFDIDVALDSIQVAYDANQRGYTTETVDDVANFALDATVVEPETQGSAVVWTVPDTEAATSVTYKIQTGGTGTDLDPFTYSTVTLTSINETVGGTAYKWKFTYDNKDYYGISRNNGTVFGEYTPAVTGDTPVEASVSNEDGHKYTLIATRE